MFELDHRTKGYPVQAPALPLAEVGAQGWHVLDDTLPYPLATLRTSALMHNLQWMQAWAARKGVQLAPHGKTTLSPELFVLQLQAGAWGMTVANVHQLRLALAAGAQRCIIANQVLAHADLEGLAHLLAQHRAQSLGVEPPDLVGRAARSVGHHETDGLGGPRRLRGAH